MQNRPDSPSRSRCASRDDVDLRTRIRAEFSEMPGLKLTLPQAARLFNLEHARCERVLGALVNGGALSSDGKAFVRAGDGRRLHIARSTGA
jgi:hypothetical protein